MKRLPTTLDKLKDVSAKLEQDAALLRKRRDQLARQQHRLERAAHAEALRRAGLVVETLGIPLDDPGYLEVLLKCGLETYPSPEGPTDVCQPPPRHLLADDFPMSTTPSVPLDDGKERG